MNKIEQSITHSVIEIVYPVQIELYIGILRKLSE